MLILEITIYCIQITTYWSLLHRVCQAHLVCLGILQKINKANKKLKMFGLQILKITRLDIPINLSFFPTKYQDLPVIINHNRHYNNHKIFYHEVLTVLLYWHQIILLLHLTLLDRRYCKDHLQLNRAISDTALIFQNLQILRQLIFNI